MVGRRMSLLTLDISAATSMTLEDIYTTLRDCNMIVVHEPVAPVTPSHKRNRRGRPPKSRQPSAVEEDDLGKGAKVVVPKHYDVVPDQTVIAAALRKFEAKHYLKLRPERLKYTPFLTTRDPGLPKHGLPAMATAEADTAETESSEIISTPTDFPSEADVTKGEDQATLDLVAALSASPVRSLRKRSADVSPTKLSKRARSVASATPRRSLRGDTRTPSRLKSEKLTPRKRIVLSEDEGTEGEVDAEGEEEE